MAAAAGSGTKQLNQCPTNVKEALEWLAELGNNGAWQCAQIIKDKKIIEGFDDTNGYAKKLCDAAHAFLDAIKGNSYTSAYNLGSWSTMCQSSGGKCCGDASGCQCQSKGSCDGCCKDCPKQICARIFCLIVPLLYRVLSYMHKQCQEGGEWAGQKINNGGKDQDNLKQFMEACAFDASQLKNTKGEDLTKKSNGTASLLGSIASELGMMKRGIDTALQNGQHKPTEHFLKAADKQPTGSSQKPKPSSLTHLLLWLQFLPYCSEYKKVLDEVRKSIKGSRMSNGDSFVVHVKETVSFMPLLFLFIEGKGERHSSSPVHGSSLFLKIAELSKCQYIFNDKYYKESTTVVKMLLCVFPVIHWGLTAVKDRCKNGSCGNIKDCDPTKKLLQSLGWNGSKESTDTNELKPIITDKTKCQSLKDYLDKQLLGDNDSIGGMKRILEEVWKDTNGAAAGAVSSGASGTYLPKTIYEMLIWLMGLPVSGVFDKFKKEKQSDFEKIKDDFTGILFQLPHLFLTLNGDLSGMLSSMFQCHGISDSSNAYQYGNEGSDCLKIFSAIVAILFPVIRYLQQRCNRNGQAFANGDSWQNTQINSDALKTFLEFMGFGPIPDSHKKSGNEFHEKVLKGIFGDLTQENGGTEKLNKLYECAKKKLEGESSKGTTAPSTIRQMMLWLIGLPVTTQYGDSSNGLMSEVKKQAQTLQINDLKNKITDSDPTSFQHQLQHSIVGMMTAISQIEGGLKSVVNFLKDGFKDTNGGSSGVQFKYGSNDELFSSFTTYVTSVHVQLRFLMVMCGRQKDQGGWQECKYANGTCQCNGNVASCLKDFLQNGNNQGGSGNKFKLCKAGDQEENKMGFNQYPTQNNGSITGASITPYLEQLLDEIPTTTTAQSASQSPPTPSKPLSLLTQYCVAIGRIDPSSLGDLFAFFLKLGTEWDTLKLYGNNNGGTFKDKLEAELDKYKIGTNGDQKQACDQLKNKITAILTTHSDHNDKKDLMSLMCTTNTNGGTCAPYMKSLSQGVYHYYLPDVQHEENKFNLLQYLYDMLRKLLDKMKELQNAFNECECCKTGSSGKSCDGLISCQYAHPILYKFGFVFGDPSKLNGSSKKKCTDIKTQLTAVLSCHKDSPSALFSAFECVIQVTYKVLLEKAKACVTTKYKTNNGSGGTEPAGDLKSTTTEMNTAFTLYVENAMYDSYPKLICTFACKVFKDGNCDGTNCKKFKAPVIPPNPSSPSSITVTSSTVTSITAVIPQYTAPVIDRYHYKAFQKNNSQTAGSPTPEQKSDGSTSYTFSDAIDFHVQGAQCISPAPVALRTLIDWILRVTTGAIATQDGNTNGNNSNDNIKHLSEEIKSVFKECGAKDSDVNVQSHLTALVDGLRKFMGYQDRSQKVKGDVTTVLGTNGTNGVKKLLEGKIGEIAKFIGKEGKDKFGEELGKALLKGRYREIRGGAMSNIIGFITDIINTAAGVQNDRDFKKVVKTFSDILTSKHKNCNSQLNCTGFTAPNSVASSSTSNGPTADGLSDLYNFFDALKDFATLWNTIGNKNGDGQDSKPSSSVVHTQKGEAMTLIKCNGSQNNNNEYFTKLYEALTALGQCADKVQALQNKNNGYENSQQYRQKISELIKYLKDEVLSKLKDSTDSQSNGKADPAYAVKGADALIKKTISKVEAEITKRIKKGVETAYAAAYGCDNGNLKIGSCSAFVQKDVTQKLDRYKSHLDDLKQLCQWLYRMGQLYAHGLKGFVESLIGHLKHINTVIGWIEKLEERLKWLNGKIENFEFERRRELVQLCKIGIENLLHGSYVLQELPDGSSDADQNNKTTERIKLLHDLRLLALDRYTLQVWQDECNPNDSRPSAIKDWITFENGIVRHSDLNAVKTALKNLTGVAYNNASPAATPSASHRIHDFHAICVIQKFSYEAPIAELERSLKELEKIKDKLEGVKGKCNGGTELHTASEITSFCTLVDQFLSDPYGIYSFAKFVHTIMGPNVFSAVIGALEELKEKEKYKDKNSGGNLDKIKGILKILTEGLDGDDHYKLENIITKLELFITTLRKEYIFAYPVVTATASQAIVPAAPHTPSPTIPTCPNRDHSMSSICKHCHPYLARIFIGAIPNLYRHCRLLYEMCKYEGIGKDGLWYNDVLQYYNSGIHYHDPCYQALGVYMSWRGWKVYKKGSDEATEKYDLSETHKGINMFQSLEAIVSLKDPFNDSDLKPLDQLFKAVMQHFKEKRETLRQQREKALEEKFKADPNNKGIPFQAPLPQLPSTVRQVLFWLHEMDTNKVFYDAMSEHVKDLCLQCSIDISHGTIHHVLNLSITQCLEVLATIEDPGRQNPQYYYELYTEEHYYAYPTVNIPLFLYTFVEKLMGAFLELNFVCVQCEFRALEGGWRDCEIGKAHQGAYEVQGSVCCICHERKTVGTPLHRVNVSGSVVCPRPLYSFLFSDPKNQLRIPSDVSQRLPYMSKGTMPCGFKLKNKAITDAATKGDAHTRTSPLGTSMTGSVLVEPLRKLVGGHVTGRHKDTSTRNDENNTLSTVIYLRDLLRYTLCLAVRPPWSMSENMAFFYRVTESWKRDNKGVTAGVRVAHPNAQLLGAIHAEIALFPGSFDASLLTSAVERFAGLAENEKHDKTNTAASRSGHHQYDLKTLMGCQETNTPGTSATAATGTTPVQCSTFMFPLSLDVYTHFDEKNSRAYLSWILNFAFGIYGQLRGLEEMMSEKECVRNASKRMSSSCPSLPTCPGVLSALYQSGSSFMDQGKLANVNNTNTRGATTTNKTCAQFHTVLQGLFNCNTNTSQKYCSPLHNLIVQCEAFLWSIRMPFSLVQLSLWSVAILFISYVFVVPLDHFKIKSHMFNRLKYTMHPSLLIADQQRRVSEVAYFSL